MEAIKADNSLRFFLLSEFLSKLFQNPREAKLNYKLTKDIYEQIERNKLPEDFIIFGKKDKKGNDNYEWEFAISSDVAIEKQFTKVNLQINRNDDSFSQLSSLVNDILRKP